MRFLLFLFGVALLFLSVGVGSLIVFASRRKKRLVALAEAEAEQHAADVRRRINEYLESHEFLASTHNKQRQEKPAYRRGHVRLMRTRLAPIRHIGIAVAGVSRARSRRWAIRVAERRGAIALPRTNYTNLCA